MGGPFELLWRRVRRSTFLSKAQFLASLDGWTMQEHWEGDLLVGVAMTRGPEFHFTLFDTGRPVTRKMVRQYLLPVLQEHGRVCTRTPKDDERQHRFNRLLGFKDVGADEFYTHYELKKGETMSRILRSEACRHSQ